MAGAVAGGGCYREVVAKLSSILTSLVGGMLSSLLGGSKTRDAAASRAAHATGRAAAKPAAPRGAAPSPSGRAMDLAQERGRHGKTATVQIDARAAGPLRIAYAPEPDGAPDPGEIVWTWVPYEEDPSQGKDRPVLLIARRDARTLLALQMTSQDHDRDAAQEARAGRFWMDIGTGPWDSRGRPSEVRLNRFIEVRESDVRREGAILDRAVYDRVVEAARQYLP